MSELPRPTIEDRVDEALYLIDLQLTQHYGITGEDAKKHRRFEEAVRRILEKLVRNQK